MCLGAANLYENMNGTVFTDGIVNITQSFISQTTLGNVLYGEYNNNGASELILPKNYQSWLELVITVVFVCFFFWITNRQDMDIVDIKRSKITAAGYSIAIKNLPNNKNVSKESLKEFFEQFGEVHNVSIAYCIEDLISLRVWMPKLMDKIERAEAYEKKEINIRSELWIHFCI